MTTNRRWSYDAPNTSEARRPSSYTITLGQYQAAETQRVAKKAKRQARAIKRTAGRTNAATRRGMS